MGPSEEWIGLWGDVGDFVFIVGKMSYMKIIIEVFPVLYVHLPC